MLALEDLMDKDEADVKHHIANEYSDGTHENVYKVFEQLRLYKIHIAYESVGNWGCDSSGWFLLSKDNKWYTINGSHCSCHGFEGQFDLEETSALYLKSDNFYLPCGGYDSGPEENTKEVINYIINHVENA